MAAHRPGSSPLNKSTQATSQSFSPAFSTPTLAHSVASLLHKPFLVGPGYSPIPEKLVKNLRPGNSSIWRTYYPKTSRPRIPSPKRTWMENYLCLLRRGYERLLILLHGWPPLLRLCGSFVVLLHPDGKT